MSWRRWWGPFRAGSGPVVARLFHCALSLVLIAAWVSLGVQVDTLIGSQGLMPVASALDRLADNDQVGFFSLPTLFWIVATDFVIGVGVLVGVLLAALSLIGFSPRISFLLSAVLYLSYAVAGDVFLAFQWDNLLVETCVLAALLPIDRARPIVHFLFRVLLFKLYFESGIAKWQSHLGDWQDGSAMGFYFETAPLPTSLAWYAHKLPAWMLQAMSWGTLLLELVVPWFVFGPRRTRTVAAIAFTGFQVFNTLTANYGFFTYLSCALHLFLIDDAQLGWLVRRLPRWVVGDPAGSSLRPPVPDDATYHTALTLIAAAYIWLSLLGAVVSFFPSTLGPGALRDSVGFFAPFRVVNVYHLFGHITRARIEPIFEVQQGGQWRELNLHWKPGDTRRSPSFVAPHQPRVDFRLWFYGLSAQHGAPDYVRSLVRHLCRDPVSVQALFETQLPSRPDAVRIRFDRYRFSTGEERDRDGVIWVRQEVGAAGPWPCITTP